MVEGKECPTWQRQGPRITITRETMTIGITTVGIILLHI
jgi:hypothetical protein